MDYVECAEDDVDRRSDDDEASVEDVNVDEEEGGGDAADRSRTKKSSAIKKKSKSKKKKKKKKGDKKKDTGRLGGKKPYKDEAPDMIKFDEKGAKEGGGSSSGGSSLYAIDSDDDDDFSSYESETSSDMEEIDCSTSVDSSVKKSKKKRSKKSSKKKTKRRKARGAGGVGATFLGRFFSAFSRKKVSATADERVPMNLAPSGDGYEPAGAGKMSGSGSGSGWGGAVGSMFAAAGGSRVDFDDDLVEDAANQIRMNDAVRAKRFRRKCCILLAVLAIIGGIVGLTLAVWFDYGDFAKLKKHFLGQGGGKPKKPTITKTPGVPFDVNADVAGVCSEEDAATFNGYYACRGLCDSAYCCFLPPWESHTCSSTFATQCEPYTNACAILDRMEQPKAPGAPGEDTGWFGGKGGTSSGIKDDALAPADPNLLSLCSGSNVKSAGGLAKCNEACEPGKCCFVGLADEEIGDDVEDCYMDNKYACAAYHPCVDSVSYQGGGSGGTGTGGGGGGGASSAAANTTHPDGSPIIHAQNFQFERRRLVLEQACSKRGVSVSGACEQYCVGYECCFGDEAASASGKDDACHDEATCMEMGACANLLM